MFAWCRYGCCCYVRNKTRVAPGLLEIGTGPFLLRTIWDNSLKRKTQKNMCVCESNKKKDVDQNVLRLPVLLQLWLKMFWENPLHWCPECPWQQCPECPVGISRSTAVISRWSLDCCQAFQRKTFGVDQRLNTAVSCIFRRVPLIPNKHIWVKIFENRQISKESCRITQQG